LCLINEYQYQYISIKKIATCLERHRVHCNGHKATDHITLEIAQLQWLKIAERIEYKVALLTFKAVTTHQLAYLYDLTLILCSNQAVTFEQQD